MAPKVLTILIDEVDNASKAKARPGQLFMIIDKLISIAVGVVDSGRVISLLPPVSNSKSRLLQNDPG